MIGFPGRYRDVSKGKSMKVINENQLENASCGEVGATKMGDDYHYTGSAGVISDYISCLGGGGGGGDYWWSRLLVCLF